MQLNSFSSWLFNVMLWGGIFAGKWPQVAFGAAARLVWAGLRRLERYDHL